MGTVEAGNKACLLRNQVTVGCSENVTSFLTELGFRAEFEFLNKVYNSGLKILPPFPNGVFQANF